MTGLGAALLVACCLALLPAGAAIECYKCSGAKSFAECNKEENVVDCDSEPGNTQYDACRTQVSYTKQTGYWIKKQCGVSPCSLSDAQSAALGMQCDRQQVRWMCDDCCDVTRCNPTMPWPRPAPVWLLTTLITSIFMREA